MATKDSPIKVKVNKLTYYAGRLYKPGETVSYAPEDAAVISEHYGRKLGEPDPAPSPAVAAVRNAKAASGEV